MKILIFGATGMVGSGLVNAWKEDHKIIAPPRIEADLLNFDHFSRWCKVSSPIIDECDIIVYAAGDVGGISAQNNYHKQVINSTMYLNFLECLKHIRTTTKVFNLSSSCMYPVKSRKLYEFDLLEGNLEHSNLGYGMSKIFGTTLLQNWNDDHENHENVITLVLPNLYSSISNNNFDLDTAHVAQALIAKFQYAKANKHVAELNVWGTGNAIREYMDVAEIPKIIESLLEIEPKYDVYNVGSSSGIQIKSYVKNLTKTLDYRGNILYDTNRLEGTLYKVMDNSRFVLETGYTPQFDENQMIQDLLENLSKQKGVK